MKIKFLDILAWIFLIATVILLLWYMFGDSPAEIIIYSGIAGFVLIKMWNFNGRLIKLERGTRHGFEIIRKDIILMKSDINLVKADMSLVKSDMGLVKDNLNLIREGLSV